jgi:hypothetical protein
LLAASDGFLPVTEHGPVGWNNKRVINIHIIAIIAIIGGVNEFIEADVELNLDDDYHDVLIRIFSRLTNFHNCCMNYFNTFVEKGKLSCLDMPQLYFLPYLRKPLIINLMNLILLNSQGISPKGIARLN